MASADAGLARHPSVASGEAHGVLQIIAARLRLPSRCFSDPDLDNAVRAVLWDTVQEFDLLPRQST